MATLPSDAIDRIWQAIMSEYSHLRKEIPVTKNQLRSFIDIVDQEMETCETAIVQAVPPGDIRDWLIANPEVGRDIVIRTENERREVL